MGSAARVLVCDDDARSVRALRVVLPEAGFRVVACASAEDALDAAALRMPAAAIVELALPDADGVALVRKLREWSAIPVVVLSAIDDEHHVVRALNAGADDYVTKPFAPRELIARLHATMRRARSDALEPLIEVDGLAVDLGAARRLSRRRGGPSHADRIHTARCVAAPPRTPAHPRGAAPPGLGTEPRARHTDVANAHRQPAAQARVTAHSHDARRGLSLRLAASAARADSGQRRTSRRCRPAPSCLAASTNLRQPALPWFSPVASAGATTGTPATTRDAGASCAGPGSRPRALDGHGPGRARVRRLDPVDSEGSPDVHHARVKVDVAPLEREPFSSAQARRGREEPG